MLIFACQVAVALQPMAAEPGQAVKGTHVLIDPPAGFTVTERFPGYLSEDAGSSITVHELPGPFEKVGAGMNEAGCKKQGMTLLGREEITIDHYKGLLLSIAQTVQETDYNKWIAVFGDQKITYLVTATFPKEADRKLSESLKKTVIAARITTRKIDPIDGVTFRVTPLRDMKITKILGNGIILTKDGAFPAKAEETPLLVAVASASLDMKISARKDFAIARLRMSDKMKNIRIQSTEPITVDRLAGFESIGEAKDIVTGKPLLLYHVTLFDEDGYYLIQGMCPPGEGQARLATFKELAATFKRVKQTP